MSTSEFTRAQYLGVTDTSTSSSPGPIDEPGRWEEPTLEEASIEAAFGGEIGALIPGQGSPSEDCGEWMPRAFCDGPEPHVDLTQHACGRRECPRCWSSQWAGPRTVSVVQRLAAGRWAEEDGPGRRLVHGMVSPPEGSLTSIEALLDARGEAVDLAKEHGIRGGVVIVHGYRPTGETKAAFAAAKEEGYDRGIWRWIQDNDTHWFQQVYWSPHFHVIGLCRDFEEGDSEADDGWVVQNLSTGKGVEPNPGVDRRFSRMESLTGEDAYEDMIRVVRYLLSHATFRDSRQAVTWMGSMHGTNFDPEEELSGGAWRTIQSQVEELVGGESDRSTDVEAGEEECPVDGCEGALHPIWDVPAYLDQRGDDLSLEALTRLRAAYDWAIGAEDELYEPIPELPTEAKAGEYLERIS